MNKVVGVGWIGCTAHLAETLSTTQPLICTIISLSPYQSCAEHDAFLFINNGVVVNSFMINWFCYRLTPYLPMHLPVFDHLQYFCSDQKLDSGKVWESEAIFVTFCSAKFCISKERGVNVELQ